MYVRSCAVKGANILTGNANVILDGRAKNALCGTMNAKYLIATGMVIVLTENVLACAAIKENSVRRVRYPPPMIQTLTKH